MFVHYVTIIPSEAEELGLGVALLREEGVLWEIPFGSWLFEESRVGQPIGFSVPDIDADTLLVTLARADHSHTLELWGPATPVERPFEEWGDPIWSGMLPAQPESTPTQFAYSLKRAWWPVVAIGTGLAAGGVVLFFLVIRGYGRTYGRVSGAIEAGARR